MHVLVLLLSLSAATLASDEENTLKLIQVFFRHGARTPELKDTYPNDPFTLETFWPTGWGQLSNLGKQQAHKLGKLLRQRYNDFLGNVYYPGMVHAQSTDYDRTKMSGQLVLAGLFPPSSSQEWDANLKWQPIPLEYEKETQDYFLRRPKHYCPIYVKELEDVYESDEYLSYIKANREHFDYITVHSARSVDNTSEGMAIFQTLTAETYLNLSLPEWTKKVYPEKITEMALKQCLFENSRPILRKLNGGRSLQKIIENIIAWKSSEEQNLRKIYLYSAHENNVLNILSALGLYDAHFPFYSSAVIIELHYLDAKKEYAVKIVYERSLDEDFEEKQIKGCEILCPLDKFLDITKLVVPGNYTADCGSSINLD